MFSQLVRRVWLAQYAIFGVECVPMDTKSLIRIAELRAALQTVKGRWRSVADLSGVPYSTVTKIAQGHTDDPRMDTAARLYEAALTVAQREQAA